MGRDDDDELLDKQAPQSEDGGWSTALPAELQKVMIRSQKRELTERHRRLRAYASRSKGSDARRDVPGLSTQMDDTPGVGVVDLVLVVPRGKAPDGDEEQGEEQGESIMAWASRRLSGGKRERVQHLQAATSALVRAGLEIQVSHSSDGNWTFFMLSASDARLAREAERSHFDKRLRPEYRVFDVGFREFSVHFKGLFARGLDGYFSALERQQLILRIIEADRRRGGAGLDLDRLVVEGVITDYISLPAGAYVKRLRTSWIRTFGSPPIDDIRDYLGERVAFYFAWVTTYTAWLGGLALVSLAVQIYAWVTSIDNVLLPVYCVVVCVWCTLFLEWWKRRNVELAYRWDSEDLDAHQPLRPEFIAKEGLERRRGLYTPEGFVDAPDLVPEERAVPYYPEGRRKVISTVNLVGTLVLMCGVSATVIGIFAFKVFLAASAEQTWWGANAVNVAAFLNTVFITIMNYVWAWVSIKLNDMEVHHSDDAYENALIVKTFAFQFINSYIALFYLAFIAGAELNLFGLREEGTGEPLHDSCPPAGDDGQPDCMLAMYSQMQMIILVKQGSRHVQALLPLLYRWYMARRANMAIEVEDRTLTQRIEHELSLPEYAGTFVEYNETILQFGYMTMFAVAYPLGAVICFLNNVLERQTDAIKVLLFCRRPRAMRANSIGVWESILHFISILAVFTNCLVMYLSSDALKFYGAHSTALVIVVLAVEHVLFALKYGLATLIPDTPFWVTAAKARMQRRLREIELNKKAQELTPSEAVAAAAADGDDHRKYNFLNPFGRFATAGQAAPETEEEEDEPDVVLVFKAVEDDTEEEKAKKIQEQRLQLKDDLTRAGLNVSVSWGSKGERLYYLLTGTDGRFDEAAEDMHMSKRLQYEEDTGSRIGYKVFHRKDKHLFASAQDEFFTELERQMLTFHVVEGDARENGAGLDLDRLVVEGVITDYISLPAGAYVKRLRTSWIRTFGSPPIDDIRDYLGERVAFYFAWVTTYTAWLGGLALVSLAVQIYAWVTSIDNVLLPVYCVVVCVWCTLFLEWWKRRNAELAYIWDSEHVSDFEPLRPEFIAKEGLERRRGLYTAQGFVEIDDDPGVQQVPYFSEDLRRAIMACNSMFTLMLGFFVVTSVIGIFAFKVFLAASAEQTWWSANAVNVAAFLNTVFITIMNYVWAWVSIKLNDMEVHRSDDDYENALIVKTFAFQFINSYIALFYLAFIAGAELNLFGLREEGTGEPLHDSCPPAGDDGQPDCMLAMYSQMQMIILVKQGSRHVQALLPLLYRWYMARRANMAIEVEDRTLTQRIEHELSLPEYAGTFVEYNEMILQFGYMTMFAVAYPFGAVICFLNNVLERQTDAIKVLLLCRRPRAMRANSIGVWESILHFISILAVFTNCLVMYLSSKSLRRDFRLNATGVVMVSLAVEHALFLFKFGLSQLIPDTPFWVTKERARTAWRVNELELVAASAQPTASAPAEA